MTDKVMLNRVSSDKPYIHKSEYYILIPSKSTKNKKNDPTYYMNKFINKYNTKNKKYYDRDNNINFNNSTYISNSDVYIEHY